MAKSSFVPVFIDGKSYGSAQYKDIIQGIESGASRFNLRVQVFSEEELPSLNAASLPPVAIVTGTSLPFLKSVVENLSSAGVRTVLGGLDNELFGSHISCATPSRRVETQQLVNYLCDVGRGSIALCGFGAHSINDMFRYHAALSAMAARGMGADGKEMPPWNASPLESFELFREKASRYDAVICPNDMIAAYFINHFERHGIRVPEDLYVAGFGNACIGRFFRPGITTTTMDMVKVGQQTFNVLRFLTDNLDQEMALKVSVRSRIIIRASTANAEAAPNLTMPRDEAPADPFYSHPLTLALVRIENCLSLRDELDLRIMGGLMDGKNYEQLSDDLFISNSTLRYRLNKIYSDAGVKGRAAFEELIRSHMGEGNPFETYEN